MISNFNSDIIYNTYIKENDTKEALEIFSEFDNVSNIFQIFLFYKIIVALKC